MWLRIIPFRLACSRESHTSRNNPFQLTCFERSSVSWSFPAACYCRPRLSLPSPVYRSRIPNQDGVHYLLAHSFSANVRSTRSRVCDVLFPSSSISLTLIRSSKPRVFLLDRFSFLYITIAIPLIAYCSLFHQIIFGPKLEFLPLMFISSYSAIGVLGSWLGFLVVYLSE